jgi:hypothetical protein
MRNGLLLDEHYRVGKQHLVDTECMIAWNRALLISPQSRTRHITKCHLEEEKGEENEKKTEKRRRGSIIWRS